MVRKITKEVTKEEVMTKLFDATKLAIAFMGSQEKGQKDDSQKT